MLNNPHFYNRTIRKIVVAFGTMFNDIQLIRYTKDGLTAKEVTKVPLSYGAKEKYLTRITSDPTLTKSINTVVPRMSFDLVGLSYDSTRKQISTLQNFATNSSTGLKTQYVPIPYNFDFSLSIYVRNTEDGTQILEQILPSFTPDFTVSVDFIKEMGRSHDIPVILNSVTPEVDYEGDFMNTRLIIWNLTFTVKGYIWPGVRADGSAQKLIRSANVNILDDKRNLDAQKVYVDKANGKGVYTTTEQVIVAKRGITGNVIYWSNNSTGTLVVGDLNKNLYANDTVQGLYSNAIYKISTVDNQPVKTVVITVQPDPITANANSVYGFEEIFTEFPNTLL
jgi:hypothetical protein